MVLPLLSLLRVRPLRLLRMPALRVTSRDAGRTTLAVDGLVCGLCAQRARSAIAAVPGAGEVRVDLESGVAELLHPGRAAPATDALARALDGAVVARGARRALATLASRTGGAAS